jgi:nucleotide-binding universal stress UspA family protein
VTEAPRPIQLVVAYDLSPSGDVALKRAIEVVARAPHHVLHVITVLDAHRGLQKVTYDNAEAMQQTLRDHVGAAFNNRPTAAEVQFFIHCRIGRPVEEILTLCEEVGADLIFVGSHNKVSLERVLLGSVSERIVREAKCPVMVARPKAYDDVDLLKVVQFDHPHKEYVAPHRYSYVETRLIARPSDWPLN